MRLFLFGAVGYPLLELLYRRRTHYTMAIAGGLSAWLIGRIRRLRVSFLCRCMLGGLCVTGVEYLCGRIWNRDYRIWDYRRTPLNLQGQVCLPFTLAWCGLSGALMAALDLAGSRKRKRTGS